MRKIRDRVAGLDVHRDTVVACTQVCEPDGVVSEIQTFATTSAGLARLIGFVLDAGVSTVAMEATGVYWKPVYYALEGVVEEVWLCNAAHVKNVPGRKTDICDAQWLADVASHGMVRPSYVPPAPVRVLRDLTRYRKTLVTERVREIQRLEKVLQDAGIKLTSVASTVWSASSRDMIEALIAGQHDPVVLAQMARSRMRAKIPQLQDALNGRFQLHHAILAQQIIDHLDFLDASIVTLTEQIAERIDPFQAAVVILTSIPGIGQTAAEIIIAETGADMSVFPTAGHLCAWAGLAPANHESAGRSRSAGTRKSGRWLRQTMIEVALSAVKVHDSYYGALLVRIAHRQGRNKAIVAVAHSIMETIWHLLTNGDTFVDPGADYYTRRRNPEAEVKRLSRRIQALGYTVTVELAA